VTKDDFGFILFLFAFVLFGVIISAIHSGGFHWKYDGVPHSVSWGVGPDAEAK